MNDVQMKMFPQLWLYTSILMTEKKFTFEEALDNIHARDKKPKLIPH